MTCDFSFKIGNRVIGVYPILPSSFPKFWKKALMKKDVRKKVFVTVVTLRSWFNEVRPSFLYSNGNGVCIEKNADKYNFGAQ